MVWSGSPVEATSLLVAEGERAVAHDPALAATMLADAANGCTATNAYHRAEELAERAVALLPPDCDPAARAPVLVTLAWALILRAKTARARALLDEAGRLAHRFDPLGPHWPWLHLLLRARVPLGDFAGARDDGLALCDRAREAGALATLGGALPVVADAAFRLGDWDTAASAAQEAIRVAGETGQESWHGYALTVHARVAAARGDAEAGRAAGTTAVGIAEACGIRSGLRFARGALGFVELSAERVDAAIVELERVDRLVADSGLEEPTIIPWAADLVEAYARAGRTADARRVLDLLERQAGATGVEFARAGAARCRGMLDDDFEPAFAAALAIAERAALPFEGARTLLALGRRLHRARRRAEARDQLRAALAGFDALGAHAWAAQAQHELRAAGARRRAPRDNALTPQEQRVAAAVCRGASNREIAAELYLTPKTIAFHLRQIYRKLGVRSRTQLAAKLAAGDEAMAAPRAAPPRSS
jgi:DNA-binding CsgD family transcriptional regulator